MKVEINERGKVIINGIEINEEVFDKEIVYYRLVEREDLIDNLITWISEENKDKEIMIMDLKYLISLPDKYIFSSIDTNEYIALSKNPKEFLAVCEDILYENNHFLENYFVLSYDRGDVLITQFKAEDRDRANEIFEEEIGTNFSTDWILDEDDFDKLVKCVKEFEKDDN